ncbi:MAG: uroporphyrinogen decarboxylase family protein [Spirochaetia bacterium]
MTSRERVMTAFEHQEPDKVPRWCGASDEFWAKAKRTLGLDDEGLRLRFGDDFRRVFSRYKGPAAELEEEATWESPFGVQRKGIGYGQPLSHPLAGVTTVEEAADYRWPRPEWADVSHVAEDARIWRGEYAVLGGEWSPYWHDVIDLVGHENLYYMMFDYPEVAEEIFRRVVDYYYEVSKNTFEAAADEIDIFFIGNDLGSQNGPLLSVDLFRRFILPGLKRLIDLGHRYGLKVMLHCCGGFRPLIPDMIEAGLDGLHALQPDAVGMDPAGLKRDFGDAILLNGAIDSHHIVIDGESPEWVRKKTLEILEIMSPGGGYVAGASHDTILEETPVENVLAMFDAVEEFSR